MCALCCAVSRPQLLPQELSGAALELLPYWLDSFGNPTRIDYGTGHETTFVAFLYCLAALGLVTEADRAALVCVVFNRCGQGCGAVPETNTAGHCSIPVTCEVAGKRMRCIQTTYWLEAANRQHNFLKPLTSPPTLYIENPVLYLICNLISCRYLELMRHIQTTYWLEPAGSHGVWGLDDYQFLPFVWGSGQLVGHPLIRPKSIHNTELLEAYREQYMYLACVKFVKTVRTSASRPWVCVCKQAGTQCPRLGMKGGAHLPLPVCVCSVHSAGCRPRRGPCTGRAGGAA